MSSKQRDMGKLAYAAALIVLVLALFYKYYLRYDYVQVNIDKGVLRGYKTTTWSGRPFFGFIGIPYAKPPIDELRFKAPQEETAWAGVRDAISHGNICPQLDIVIAFLRGDEDCLFLNVYTPSLGDNNLPVMVWIHGGGFEQGSGNDELYGPDYLVGSGIILVTMNYRLSALGFLSTGDDGAPGNAGLKDQVAALRWVRRNIKRFGGDPDNVTIFGESAGGACVHYHLLSPMSAGLFVRAIAQSGTSINTWAIIDNAPANAVRLAEGLGAKDIDGDVAKALEFLKSAPYKDIVNKQGNLRTAEEIRNRIVFLFVPTVEKNVNSSEEVFLPDTPVNILKSGNFSKIPFITGHTSHEGYFFIKSLGKPKIRAAAIEDTERYVPHDIKDKAVRNELAKSIRKFYFDDKPVGNENISNFVNLHTDITFAAGMQRATKLQLQSSKSPIYQYILSYSGGLNTIKTLYFINDLPGAAHGDDLGYLFFIKLFFWKRPIVGSEDAYVLQTMVRLWTNFAKYGVPTPPGDPLNWKPVTLAENNYLNISGRDTRSDVNAYFDRVTFWTKAYEIAERLKT